MDVGDNCRYYYRRDEAGNLLSSSILESGAKGSERIVKFREYTGNGHIIVDDSLKMTRFPDGYFTPDGGVYYYINDYQGNICKFVDKTGRVYQTMDYYPYGASFPRFGRPDPKSAKLAVEDFRAMFPGEKIRKLQKLQPLDSCCLL